MADKPEAGGVEETDVERLVIKEGLSTIVSGVAVQFLMVSFILWTAVEAKAVIAGLFSAALSGAGIGARFFYARKRLSRLDNFGKSELKRISRTVDLCVFGIALGWAVAITGIFPNMTTWEERSEFVAVAIGSMAMSAALHPLIGSAKKIFISVHVVAMAYTCMLLLGEPNYLLAVVYALLGYGLAVAGRGIRESAVRMQRSIIERDAIRKLHGEQLEASMLQAKKAAELEEEAAIARQRMFVGKVSHEIRTPIQMILGIVESVEDGAPLTEKNRARMVSASKILLGEMGRLSDYVRRDYEGGGVVLKKAPCEVRKMLGEVISLHEEECKRKGLDIRFKCDVETVSMDEHAVRQCVVNLLGNAVKYTQHGYVIVTCRLEPAGRGHQIVIAVKDSGVGMSEEELENIYQPFFRGEATGAVKGMGLGMSIVKSLIESMRGQINVTSQLGIGTTVEMCVPVDV